MRSRAARIDASVVEARAERVCTEVAQQRLGCTSVRQAEHRLAERQVLVDLRRDRSRVASAPRLRDERDVGLCDPANRVVPARRWHELDLHSRVRDLFLDLGRDVTVENEP